MNVIMALIYNPDTSCEYLNLSWDISFSHNNLLYI